MCIKVPNEIKLDTNEDNITTTASHSNLGTNLGIAILNPSMVSNANNFQ